MSDDIRLRASDVGSALGVGRKGAFTVWHELAGKIPTQEANQDDQAIAGGRMFEEPIAKMCERFYDLQIVDYGPGKLVHPSAPLIGHPDRYVRDREGNVTILEIKLVFKGEDAERWGPAGTDQVPKDYYLQLLSYLSMWGQAQYGYLGAWFAGVGLRLYRVPVVQAVEAGLLRDITAFVGSVKAGLPPDASTLAEMRQRWLADKTKRKLIGLDVAAQVGALKALREQKKLLEQQEEQLAMAVLAAAGDAGKLAVQRGTETVDICSLTSNRVFDAAEFAAKHPDVAARYQRLDTTRLRQDHLGLYESCMREPKDVSEQVRVIRPMTKGLEAIGMAEAAKELT